VPNAALLGGFAALTGLMSLPAVEAAIAARFSDRVAVGNRNWVAACIRA
jgi:pyruvate ferredoxin oxidoreductase gamma subunit